LAKQPTCSFQEKEQIRRIVNQLIVEFREIGYTEKEIREIPRKIFSSVQSTQDGIPYWEFPHAFECDDWEDKARIGEYKQQLENFHSNLNEADRLKALLTIAKRKKRPIRYIFRINGMTEIEELEIGKVIFYMPTAKRFVKPSTIDPDNTDELFRASNKDKSVNATVVIEAVSAMSGESIARIEVEKALSISRRVLHGESPLWISRSYIALNDKNEISASSHSMFERDSDDWTKSFKVEQVALANVKDSLSKFENTRQVASENGWERRFNEACSWLRKAEESSSTVDKLLAYWICMETLCAKTEGEAFSWFEVKNGQEETDIYLIKEVVGKMRALGKCYEHGWMVFHHLSFLVSPMHLFGRKKLQIPAELLNRAQLLAKPGEQIWLKNFINCCDEIEKVLPDGLLKDQVGELSGFYKDKNLALKTLKSHLRTTQDELAFIYRMRNKIAHDGSSEHPLLPSLCKLASEYSNLLIHQVLHYVTKREKVSLDEILITAVQDYDRIEMQLEKEEPMDVLLTR
jgi:hypothetical protein